MIPSRPFRCLGSLIGAALLSVSFVVLLPDHVASAAEQGTATHLPLQHVADISMPGRTSRFDYESGDPERHLLMIAHLGDGEVLAFDTHSARVIATIPNVSAVHGVLVVPELSRVFASATGTNEIVAIDEKTLKVVARMPGGVYPDGMAYAPDVHKLYVSDETGKTETVIDATTNHRVKTIALDGEVGNTQYDSVSRHIFVNVQTRRQLVEIDPSTDTIVARIDLPGADGNHGLLIVPHSRLAFIACEGNSKLLVLDLRTKRVSQSFDVGRDPDVLALDASTSTVYVAGEAGVISMFRYVGTHVAKVGEGFLGPNAHVVYVDSATHRSYFALKDLNGHPVLRIMTPL
ncbi:YVTN beta-propeller repeat-containing protein [Caballeronia catudaia]|uniref:YVTN beta-propeller repeat-containing protein n=1 Tax=Caballeronia catudaia TaxID=1777136 RepID=A0A158DMX5_9BURK|nr:YncE family protein [Caballeronia catudaia]SAK95944.1 YVTN beta-propeller repeat-containing protein [Caballeronia catudaia]